ncbi:MAG: hypothetical protein HKO66_15855 [Saprospiraceae bacterium]|nr:hypothetical protein [Saprospiraceae bacterium]NNL93717.1 hypothetical protein [Saprospiraceae bacterium]
MKLIAYIFIFFCFFPYLDFFNLGTDTQPTAMIMSTIIIFAYEKQKLNLPIILLWVLFIISLLFALGSTLDSFTTMKIIMNYLSPPLIAMAAYSIYRNQDFKLNFGIFCSILGIYFIVGVIQAYFISDFMTLFLNEGRGIMVGGRGVVSLTTEPSFYGSICLFFMVFSILNYDTKRNIYVALFLLFQVVFLAKSATTIALIGGSVLVFGTIQLMRFKLKYVLALFLFLSVSGIFHKQIFGVIEDTRIGAITTNFMENPLLIAQVDGSVATRLCSTVAPYFVIRHKCFKPMGYGRFLPFLKELNGQGKYKKLITKVTLTQRQRILGSINMALFQFGFIGLILPIAIFLAFRRLFRRDINLYAFILFILILFTQIQLTHAMTGLIFATALFKSKLMEKQSKAIA